MKKLTAIGNIGYDAVIKEYNGRKFLSFSIAINENYKDGEGNKIEKTEWINCTSYQTNLAAYLTKGKQIYIEGNPSVKPYQNHQGQWLASFNVHVYQIQLLQGGKQSQNQEDNKEEPF